MTPVGSLLIGAPRLLSAALKLVPTMGGCSGAKQKLDIPLREDFLCYSLFSVSSWQKCTFSAQLLWRPSFFYFICNFFWFFCPFKQQLDAASASATVAAKLLLYHMDGWMDGCNRLGMLTWKKKKNLVVCWVELRIWMQDVCVSQTSLILKPLNKLCGAAETHSSDTGLIPHPPAPDC